MSSQTCSACGGEVAEVALRAGIAIRHGARVYCQECASLIMSDDRPSIPAPAAEIVSPPKTVKSTRVADGVVVVEEFRISAGPLTPIEAPKTNLGPAGAQPMQTEDDWFKPSKQQSGRMQVAEPEPPAAPAPKPQPSGRFPGSPKASGRTNAVKPSGRMAKPAPVEVVAEAEVVDEPVEQIEAPVADRKKSNSGRLSSRGGLSGRTSGRTAAAKSSKRIELRSPAPAPVAEPEFEVVEEEAPAPKPMSKRAGSISARSGSVSRRGSAAAKSSKTSKRGRDDDDEREEKRDRKKAPQGMSTTTMIGIGVGVMFLLIIGIAASRRGKDDGESKKAGPAEVLDDKTPYQRYVQLAQEAERGGNVSTARDFYVKAANQAEKQGNPTYARDLTMKSMNIIKSSKRSDR